MAKLILILFLKKQWNRIYSAKQRYADY